MKTRYFIFGAKFILASGQSKIEVFPYTKLNEFPTMFMLKLAVKTFYNAENISITSICEVEKEDYRKFWSEQ
jgi:hypothetical protein